MGLHPVDETAFVDCPDTGRGSPAGGSEGLCPERSSIPLVSSTAEGSETFPQVGERGGPVAQRARHTGRARDVRRGEHQVEVEGLERCRDRHRVEDQRVLHRLVPDQQVVVDLHDDQASSGKNDPGPLGKVVRPVARCPEAEQRDLGEIAERSVR